MESPQEYFRNIRSDCQYRMFKLFDFGYNFTEVNIMEPDTIEEITEKIDKIKMILLTEGFSNHVIEMYESKIEAWEAEIEMIKFG